jgi:cellulose synthase/poly-beta-1,6-N-acetylglucosamine synthase-like glycosyltransferase
MMGSGQASDQSGHPADAGRVDMSVLVPTLNEEAHIEETLRALQDQRFDGELEFLFIDGGSSDGTRAALEHASRRDPRIRVLGNPHGTTPHALNVGLAHARGEYVARMDAHAQPRSDYLRLGVERLQAGDVDWVSGPQVAVGRGRWSTRVALALETRLGIGGATFRNPQSELETDTGFLGVWRRRTLLEHDGWDEGWPINQDSELAARVRAAGGRIVTVPAMAVEYFPRDDFRRLARQYWRYGQYRAKTSRAHPQSMRRSHLLAPGLVLAMLAALLPLRALATPARAALGVYGAALVATAGLRAGRSGLAHAAWLPLVLATMHLAWGLGFLVGSMRFGPPVAAVRSILRSSFRRSR